LKKSATWRSPSNIALVKYWGKYSKQIPANPSISFTLNDCYTETEVILDDKKTDATFSFEVILDGESKPDFAPKIEKFFKQIVDDAPFLTEHHFTIKTHNSFPHSSGIASSASGMSALALCLLSLKEEITGTKESDFYRKASEWARLGSGSASRSVYGGLVEWGRFAGMPESNDEFAVPFSGEVAEVFKTFCDYVLLVEVGAKSVSSTAGHGLMDNHPFAERRFLQAHENLEKLTEILASGDLEAFGNLVESEALTLHAMMMTSDPSYILMKPNTVHIIERIREFRKETETPVYFTLDAGANVHVLFPAVAEQKVKSFVDSELTQFLKDGRYICDRVGEGPVLVGSKESGVRNRE